jgi:hypothetical protein
MKVSILLFALVVSVLALGACAAPTATITTTVTIGPTGTVTSTPTTTPTSTPSPTLTATYTLPATPTTPVTPQVIPDSGFISISGYGGYFNLQRVYGYIDQPTYFQGVVFAPHQESPGVTSTGPIAYKIDVQFTDGTVEVLQYIGLGNTNTLDVNLTQHEHPNAGILLAWQDISGGLTRVMYLLVNVD